MSSFAACCFQCQAHTESVYYFGIDWKTEVDDKLLNFYEILSVATRFTEDASEWLKWPFKNVVQTLPFSLDWRFLTGPSDCERNHSLFSALAFVCNDGNNDTQMTNGIFI